ncbi:cytochrome c [Phreatobacter sp.]|uniref:c-type cytochrome n=1 Tax=Phreatobacter sp. TaxID=1966341 RepID=UPI0025D78B20|nr:cytochrome c [Phreatobacter sp.]
MSRSAKVFAAATLCIGLAGTGMVLAQQRPAAPAAGTVAAAAPVAASQRTGLGREAHPAEVAAWAIAIRPDGQGLPPGSGSVKQGEDIYQTQCAACHGEFGEGAGRWPVLAGGRGSLKGESPEKTLGSFWPYLSTTFDYVRRAMPYGNAQSLSNDEVYALTAYIMYLNDLVPESFELTRENFTSIPMPNVGGFYDDDRETTERAFWTPNPCMTNCRPTAPKVTGRARMIDVTPEGRSGPRVE